MKLPPITTFMMVLATFAFPSLGWAQNVSPTEARAIAKEAYIYGYPMVDSYQCN